MLTSLMTSYSVETMAVWQVQDAKARFSAFLEAALKKGPQVVTRRGVETAVLVPIDEWRRLESSSKPTLKELLLSDGARFENLGVPRRQIRRRPALDFPS